LKTTWNTPTLQAGRDSTTWFTGLWDSFADDALSEMVEAGLYFDPEKMHVPRHKGKYLSVRGPLKHRPPHTGLAGDRAGRASNDGRQLAAETRRKPCSPARQA